MLASISALALAALLGQAEQGEESALQINLKETVAREDTSHASTGWLSEISSVALSPDAKLLAWGTRSGRITVKEMVKDGTVRRREPFEREAHLLRFSANGRLLAAACMDSPSRVQVYDTTTWDEWGLPQGRTRVLELAIPDSGKGVAVAVIVASIHDDKFQSSAIHFYDLATHFPSLKPIAWEEPFTAVAFSPDLKTFATAFRTDITVWSSNDVRRPLAKLNGHEQTVSCLSFSCDGKLLASAAGTTLGSKTGGAEDGLNLNELIVWDTKTAKEHLVFSRIKVVDKGPNAFETIRTDGKELLPITSCLAFSPDCKILVTGSADSTVTFWSMQSGKTLARVNAHRGGVRALSFSSDGRLLATGGSDGAVKLWEISGK